MDNDKISTALGIRPLSEVRENEKSLTVEIIEQSPLPAIQVADIDDENLRDLEEVRQNIKGIMETGEEAMREMLDVAKQSNSARAFEVVSTLMKTMLDANKDFADISTKKKFAKEEINGPREAAQTNVTNNNLIVSTADLLKMMKGDMP
jgi:gas vesicle protein